MPLIVENMRLFLAGPAKRDAKYRRPLSETHSGGVPLAAKTSPAR